MAPPNPPSDEIDEYNDDDDDNSSILSTETKPSTSSSLIKHSIENILSNKVTIKHKRPLSSFSNCMLNKPILNSSILFYLFLASNDEQTPNKRQKCIAC
jgi:hypothetical protein